MFDDDRVSIRKEGMPQLDGVLPEDEMGSMDEE